MIRMLLSLVAVLVCAACSARPDSGSALVVPDSVAWNGDAELAPVLRRAVFGPEQLNGVERLQKELGRNLLIDRAAAIAEDTSAPNIVRANALKLLANRRAVHELTVFSSALGARDEFVRLAVITSMNEFLDLAPQTATAILGQGLRDRSLRVQAQALQTLGDRDEGVLRAYIASTSNAELRGVAMDLLRVAEERGAPLVPDSSGRLERTTATGVRISFHPAQRWPNWDAAAGELHIQTPQSQQPVRVASGVEVVGGVIPAFVTADSAWLVYEANREIRVRSLRDNADRKLADGFAPRLLPFSNDIVFFRLGAGVGKQSTSGTATRFNVVRMPLAGGAEKVLGEVTATLSPTIKGNYAPPRWVRVRETDGRFFLMGDIGKPFELPSPFAG